MKHFSDDDDNDEFTLGDAVLFAWDKQKNRLEHAYAVTVWALFLLYLLSELIAWKDLAPTLENLGGWWMRLFLGCITRHVQTKKW